MLSTKDLVLNRTDPLHLDLRCMVIKKVQQNLDILRLMMLSLP